MIKIEGKHEKVKEKHKSRLWLKFLICIIVAFIIVMVGYLIVEKIKNNSNPEVTEKEEYYKIENIGNIKFENVSITIKDKMSYINIDLVNGEHQKISGQEINVKVIKKLYEMESEKFNQKEYFFLCEYIDGTFGTGDGPEFNNDSKYIDSGNYLPEIIKREEVKDLVLLPPEIKEKFVEDIKNNRI